MGHPGDEVIPWLDQPPPAPFPPDAAGQLKWEEIESWLTPPDKFHFVTHFGIPEGLDEATWSVDVVGLVARPLSLTLANLKARERREVDFTLECSGNHGTTLDFATGFIGNARWAGTPLAPVLDGRVGKLRKDDAWFIVGVQVKDRTMEQASRLGSAMRSLGWETKIASFGGRKVNAFVKAPSPHAEVSLGSGFRDGPWEG